MAKLPEWLENLFPRRPKNLPRFDLMSGEDINDYVAANLSMLSKQTTRSLIDAGWLDSAGPELFSRTNNGVFIARTNTSGQVTEANSSTINTSITRTNRISQFAMHPVVMATMVEGNVTEEIGRYGMVRTAQVSLATDGAGAHAATAIITAPAGFYPVCRLKRIISDVADADTELLFTVSGGALLGPAVIHITLVAGVVLELGTLFYDLTDATTINVAVANGPVSAAVWLEYEYWSET